MGKLLVLVLCCSALAVSHAHQDDVHVNLLSFQGKPKQGHIEALKDNYVKQLFSQLLGRKLTPKSSRRLSLRVERSNGGLSRFENPQFQKSVPGPAMDEAMLLHRELQSRLGWGGDDNRVSSPNQQYGSPPQNQYGPPSPPSQQYGPPPPPNQQYGPPQSPPNQQYGPPPPTPNQQYGPPPSPPNQQYGPPPSPPNQQYGPPPSPPNQQYGQPPSQNQYEPPPNQSPPQNQYGPPNQQYDQPTTQEYGPPPPTPQNNIRVNQGTFGGHIENFKLSDAVKTNSLNDYTPPPQSPQEQYGPPSTHDTSGSNFENPKIYKHVYIHTPPPEPEIKQQPRIIRPNANADINYQIIFVKAPSPPKEPPTEIHLPPEPEKKTLVYVLVKKPSKPAEIKFIQPKNKPPGKPEVYFIRYKGKNSNSVPEEQNGYDIQSNRDVDVDTTFGSNDNGGYSSEYDSQPEIIGTKSVDAPLSSIANNLIRDSVGYPNTEYRATPNMLNPNQEPMSIAVYDRVRNGVMPTASQRGSLDASSSNVSARVVRRQQGSHYTAPGSRPFKRSSGKMVKGEYLGMASDILSSQYYLQNRRNIFEYE